jgi:nitroimidazol reductase NimA-like FMN-containing flavoprotein (pyridoxamine 5'-phosphate oxidase superfamily)
MREMRRKKRAMTSGEARELLIHSDYGVLSTAGEGGIPYGVPLSYCVIGQNIYFHCAVEGRKIDNIGHNSSVSFCVVGKRKVLPDQFTTLYESVIVSGNAREVTGDEKQMALEGLLKKYSPGFLEEGREYIKSMDDITKVFGIKMDHITGKAKGTN